MRTTTMFHLLLLFLFLPESILTSTTYTKCGGRFNASHGTISTPNFPARFPVPIRCKWIIDAQNSDTSIIVYLTQLYVMEGLTFTELYDESYDEGKQIFSVNEDNVVNTSYVQCHREYLVITFELNSVESNHLRVLDGLLDVYGFNITYEITNGSARSDKCTMRKCGFTGLCHDHFTHFTCDCFSGYEGATCSGGEKSMCFKDGKTICKNGGTCLHVGDSAVICNCPSDYSGPHCEIYNGKRSHHTVSNALVSCPFDGTIEKVCKCPKNKRLAANDLIGFSSRVLISNLTRNEKRHELKAKFRKIILTLLRSANVSKIDDVQINGIGSQSDGTDITFRFYGSKKDEKRIRNVIMKWAQNGYIGNYTLIEKDVIVTTDPYLHLESVSINKERIHENEEFILACVARGSQNMIFRWFKDGAFINVTSVTSNKWIRLIPEYGKRDQYTALLAIQKATKFDGGTFTCQIEDYGIQQCRSKDVALKFKPSVWLNPQSLTVNKGESFTIKCHTAPPEHVKYIYQWTKDRTLLRAKTPYEHWEVLYPEGSILQVTSINKTTTYSCLVQDEKLSAETSITVNVVNDIPPCPGEYFEHFYWNETASGAYYKRNCPESYRGMLKRSCIMLENGRAKWTLPDYSNCTADELINQQRDFRSLMNGYENTTALKALKNIDRFLKNHTFYRGEAYVVLKLVEEILNFNNVTKHSNIDDVTFVTLNIFDKILQQTNSLNKEQQVLFLQRMARTQLILLANSTQSDLYREYGNLSVKISVFYNEQTFLLSHKHIMIIHLTYQNLSTFLSVKSIIRLDSSDNSEIEYKIVSSFIGVWLSQSEHLPAQSFYTVLFQHKLLDGSDEWKLRCAVSELAGSSYVWDTNVCLIMMINGTATRCNCSKQGTVALLLVKEPKVERREFVHSRNVIILIGCATCFILSTLCGFLLLCQWFCHRSSYIFLKMQCCFSISVIMVLFIIGFTNEVPKEMFLYTISLLQVFFLMGMSSQLSTLLIIYSELVEIQRKKSIKQTVVGIITGAPIIVTFGNHIAHKTMNIQLKSWWLFVDSLSFNVFISFTSIIVVLYTVLFGLVTHLLKCDKMLETRFLNKRRIMARKTLILFYTIIFMSGCSILCINIFENEIWHYVFAGSCMFMGVTILVCFVNKQPLLLKKQIFKQFHRKTANTINTPPKYEEEISDDGIDLHMMNQQSAKGGKDLSSPSIQQYNSSPTQFNAFPIAASAVSKSNSLNSPDILGTKVFVELDLVASSLQSSTLVDTISPPDQSTATTTTSATSNKTFDDCDTIPTKSIIKKAACEKVVKFCETVQYETTTTTSSEQNLDEVMNSISNDLNYLLNDCAAPFQDDCDTKQTDTNSLVF